MLMATAGVGKVDLTWTDDGSDHYNVYRGPVSGGPHLNIGSTMATECEDNGSLMVGTTYYYVVRPAMADGTAICQSNESGAMPTEAETPTASPTATTTATPTNTPVPAGGACTDSADCIPNSACVGGICVVNPARAPLPSARGLFVTTMLLLGVGGLAVLRQRRLRPHLP